MAHATLYHNPRCSKSRQTLQLLRDHGIEPTIIEYLNQPPTEQEIIKLLNLLNLSPLELMRRGETVFKEHQYAQETYSDQDRINAMVQHPILIERPIVVMDDQKAALGRPPENILTLL